MVRSSPAVLGFLLSHLFPTHPFHLAVRDRHLFQVFQESLDHFDRLVFHQYPVDRLLLFLQVYQGFLLILDFLLVQLVPIKSKRKV